MRPMRSVASSDSARTHACTCMRPFGLIDWLQQPAVLCVWPCCGVVLCCQARGSARLVDLGGVGVAAKGRV